MPGPLRPLLGALASDHLREPPGRDGDARTLSYPPPPTRLLAVLEVQLNSLPDISGECGITKESFNALCTIGYDAPRPDLADLQALNLSELCQLAHARRLDDDLSTPAEKAKLIDLLREAEESGPRRRASAAAAEAELSGVVWDEFDASRRANLPQQCAICMGDFRDNETLKVLPCSDLHAFHSDCIEQWLDKHTSCPLCRTACGERREPPPLAEEAWPPPGVLLRALMPLEELLASLSVQPMIAQLPGSDGGPGSSFLLIEPASGPRRGSMLSGGGLWGNGGGFIVGIGPGAADWEDSGGGGGGCVHDGVGCTGRGWERPRWCPRRRVWGRGR